MNDFEAKSRLKLPERKILFSKTPNGTKAISLNKTPSCGVSQFSAGSFEIENPAVTRINDEIFCVTFDRVAQKYYMLNLQANILKTRTIYEKLSVPELKELIKMLQDICRER